MSVDAQSLFELLPAVHRVRDAELARASKLPRGPLEELIAVLADQLIAGEESLEQLHDDLFIETCAEWVVPYIGDLIGYRSLHPVGDEHSARSEVAHTIALRRRKGTALVLEQLARDVTGWDARAVEYFQRLCTTQYMNHSRLYNLQSPDLRNVRALEWIGTGFETANRTVDVRNIESGRGKHNIPNVGLHLWRIRAYSHRESPALRNGVRLYRASPLGHDLPLYNRPVAESDISHIAEPDNVPWPLSRRRLNTDLDRHYGPPDAPIPPALSLWVEGNLIDSENIRICNLEDDGVSWVHTPPANGLFAIDPVLGRIALPADAPDPADVRLTWHEGFSADIGGGEYPRDRTLPSPANDTNTVTVPSAETPTIAAALTAVDGNGIIEITDSSRYIESLNIEVIANGHVEIRAQDGRRPVLDLDTLTISGGDGSQCTLNGLLITGTPLEVPGVNTNLLAHLAIVHCTLVPGIGLNTDGSSTTPASASVMLGPAGLSTRLSRSIIGAVQSHEHSEFYAMDSIIDASAPLSEDASEQVVFSAADGDSPGAKLSLDGCTLIGRVHTSEIGLISNSILFASGAGWPTPIRSVRKQTGCIRYSYLPFDSIVPTRHRCIPKNSADVQRIAPQFTSLRYGTPAYAQLATATSDEILRGADNESEMGVFHHLFGAQRETNLRIRLAEYLRVSLRAGVFYES